MFEGTMVKTGVDVPALLADAKRLAVPAPTNAVDPQIAAWALLRSAFATDASVAPATNDQRFNDTLDEAHDILANEVPATFAGAAAELRRAFVAFL